MLVNISYMEHMGKAKNHQKPSKTYAESCGESCCIMSQSWASKYICKYTNSRTIFLTDFQTVLGRPLLTRKRECFFDEQAERCSQKVLSHVSTSVFSSTRFWVTRTSGISSLIFFISGFAVFVCTCCVFFPTLGTCICCFSKCVVVFPYVGSQRHLNFFGFWFWVLLGFFGFRFFGVRFWISFVFTFFEYRGSRYCDAGKRTTLWPNFGWCSSSSSHS